MVWSEGKRGVHCGASVRRTAAAMWFRKSPLETITFSGEVPANWDKRILSGIPYSLGKHRRWEILEEAKCTDEHEDDYVTVSVAHEPVQRKADPQSSHLSARVETFTFKDALRRPAFQNPRRWSPARCHQNRRVQRQARQRNRRAKYSEFTDSAKINSEAQWYTNWSLQSWDLDTPPPERKRLPKGSSSHRSITTQKNISSLSSYRKPCHRQLSSLCSALSWKTDVVLPEDLKSMQKLSNRSGAGEKAPKYFFGSVDSRCVVCFDSENTLHDAGCGHGMCLQCWGRYAESNIEEGNGEFRCPVPDCICPAPLEIVKCMLSKEAWKRLAALQNDALVSSNPSLCYCPDPHCGRLLHTTEDAAIVQCPCGGAWCPKCKGPAHWPASCQDRRWLDANQGNLVAKSQTHTKTCPACFVEIEKNGGCSHMNCRVCKVHFCWECGSYATTTSYHKSGVPCKPTKWWLVPLSVEDPLAEYVAPHILAQDQKLREARTRLHNLGALSKQANISSLGYAAGLSIASIIQYEHRLLEMHHLVLHISLACHLNKDSVFSRDDIGTWSRGFQAHADSLLDFLTNPRTVAKGKRLAMKELKRLFGRKPNRVCDRVKYLTNLLAIQ